MQKQHDHGNKCFKGLADIVNLSVQPRLEWLSLKELKMIKEINEVKLGCKDLPEMNKMRCIGQVVQEHNIARLCKEQN